jgi:hypothetical protein
MRFACGTRVGSPAAVTSPRTGSAMIWAACLPIAHPSVPVGCATVAAAGPGEPLPGAVAGDVRLRNQSDVAWVAVRVSREPGRVSREPVPAGSGTTTSRQWFAGSRQWFAGWTSAAGRVGAPWPPVIPRFWKPA